MCVVGWDRNRETGHSRFRACLACWTLPGTKRGAARCACGGHARGIEASDVGTLFENQPG